MKFRRNPDRSVTPGLRRRTGLFFTSGALLFSTAGQAGPVDAGTPLQGGVPSGEVGTVQTLAGPQFCRGTSRLEPDAETVRSLAPTPEGQIYFDTGDPGRGNIARVDSIGRTSLISAGLSAPMPVRRPGPSSSEGPLGSRIASDGGTGIFVATGTKIGHVARGLTSIAGNDPPYSAPGEMPEQASPGPARDARFNQIMSIASDGAGGVYVADRTGRKRMQVRIRFVNTGTQTAHFFSGIGDPVPAGHIATVAGTGGQSGQAPAGPPAPAEPIGGAPAALRSPITGAPPAMAASGPLLYVAGHTGSISSAGTAAEGQKRAKAAGENRTGGRLRGRFRLQLINLGSHAISAHGAGLEPGAVRTLAEGASGYSGDGGPAAAARFSLITAMAVDAEGNLYLADHFNHRIRRVDAGGRVTTFAGSGPTGPGNGGFDGNGGSATHARLDHPFDVKTGPGRRVWISDMANGQIRVVDESGLIGAAPGMGVARDVACLSQTRRNKEVDAGRDRPLPGTPFGVVSTSKGEVFLSNRLGGQVKKITLPGVVATAAGTGTSIPVCAKVKACPVAEGGLAANARLKSPSRLALARGGIYILDAGDFRVRFVNRTNRTVSRHGIDIQPGRIVTVAGNGTLGSSGDGGRATLAQIDPDQADITADSSGNLLLSDPRNRKLNLVDAAGRMRLLIGPGRPVPGSGCCSHPQGVASDGREGLYISETLSPRVWFWNRGPQSVIVHGQRVESGAAEPVAGTGSMGFEGDGGPARGASLTDPVGLAVDRRRNLFIADRAGNTVRKVDAGGNITTVAGTGQGGFNGDGLKGALTWLSEPYALAVDPCGNLLFADSGNGRVRRLILSTTCGVDAPEAPGRSRDQAFTVPLVLTLSAVAAALLAAGARRIRSGRGRNAEPSLPPPN